MKEPCPLEDGHETSSFDCGVEALNTSMKSEAFVLGPLNLIAYSLPLPNSSTKHNCSCASISVFLSPQFFTGADGDRSKCCGISILLLTRNLLLARVEG